MSIKTYIDNAIREGKSITIKYVKFNGEISTRTLSDLQYSDEFGRDYIVGFCSLRQEMRTFKISRIREVDGIKASVPNVIPAKGKSAYNPNTTHSQSGSSTTSSTSRSSGPLYSSPTSSSFGNSGGYRPSPSSYSYQNKPSASYSRNSRKKEGCYIATMVYGDYDHPQVLVLRRFRDKQLLSTHFGKAFVKFYYWVSPGLVTLLSRKKKINTLIRSCLDRFVDSLIRHGV